MNFDFSEDQKYLRDQARAFLSDRCPPAVPRRALESGSGHDPEIWQAIAEMGWMGTVVPEAYGGLGLGYLELCVLAEEMGRALVPIPTVASLYLATEALLLGGSEEQKKRYLPAIASGAMIGTFALAERAGVVRPGGLQTRFAGGALTGVKAPVSGGMHADFAIVLAQGSAGSDEDDATLAIVDLNEAGVTRSALTTFDPSRGQARLSFEGARAEALGGAGQGWRLARQVLDRAAVLVSFEQVAGAEAALEMARVYSLDRYAFGRPIGSFQAIKHKLADVYVANVLARSTAYYGAWALSTGSSELSMAAAGARVSATKAFDLAAAENIQVHGGVGFTWEFDCQLYFRRAHELGLVLGPIKQWKEQVMSALEVRNSRVAA